MEEDVAAPAVDGPAVVVGGVVVVDVGGLVVVVVDAGVVVVVVDTVVVGGTVVVERGVVVGGVVVVDAGVVVVVEEGVVAGEEGWAVTVGCAGGTVPTLPGGAFVVGLEAWVGRAVPVAVAPLRDGDCCAVRAGEVEAAGEALPVPASPRAWWDATASETTTATTAAAPAPTEARAVRWAFELRPLLSRSG